MRRLVFLIFLFPFLASAQVTGYKIKRTHDGDTLVGYLTENAGTGRTGLVLLNDGDTAMVYSDGTYLVLDPVTGLKIKQLTYGSSQRFLSVIGERVYITDIDSFAGNADSIYVSYCDGCSGTSGDSFWRAGAARPSGSWAWTAISSRTTMPIPGSGA